MEPETHHPDLHDVHQQHREESGTQPMLGSDSNQCLSCHDGTVAVGATVAYGQVTTRGSMNTADVFGSNLQSRIPSAWRCP